MRSGFGRDDEPRRRSVCSPLNGVRSTAVPVDSHARPQAGFRASTTDRIERSAHHAGSTPARRRWWARPQRPASPRDRLAPFLRTCELPEQNLVSRCEPAVSASIRQHVSCIATLARGIERQHVRPTQRSKDAQEVSRRSRCRPRPCPRRVPRADGFRRQRHADLEGNDPQPDRAVSGLGHDPPVRRQRSRPPRRWRTGGGSRLRAPTEWRLRTRAGSARLPSWAS